MLGSPRRCDGETGNSHDSRRWTTAPWRTDQRSSIRRQRRARRCVNRRDECRSDISSRRTRGASCLALVAGARTHWVHVCRRRSQAGCRRGIRHITRISTRRDAAYARCQSAPFRERLPGRKLRHGCLHHLPGAHPRQQQPHPSPTCRTSRAPRQRSHRSPRRSVDDRRSRVGSSCSIVVGYAPLAFSTSTTLVISAACAPTATRITTAGSASASAPRGR